MREPTRPRSPPMPPQLPFRDAAFDAVLADGVVHHTARPAAALREAIRVLRPGGLLFVRIYRAEGRYPVVYRTLGGLLRAAAAARPLDVLVWRVAFPFYRHAADLRYRRKRQEPGRHDEGVFSDYFLTPRATPMRGSLALRRASAAGPRDPRLRAVPQRPRLPRPQEGSRSSMTAARDRYVLGINAFHADAAAVLLDGGEVVCAIAEERVNRQKHFAGLPVEAVGVCLRVAGIQPHEVGHVAIARDGRASRLRKLAFLASRPHRALALAAPRLTNRAAVADVPAELWRGLGAHRRLPLAGPPRRAPPRPRRERVSSPPGSIAPAS